MLLPSIGFTKLIRQDKPKPLIVENYQLSSGCTIYNIQGIAMMKLPGLNCVFLPDGRFISADRAKLDFFTPSEKSLWQIRGYFHDSMNLSEDSQKILTIETAFANINGALMRIDVFKKIDLGTGKVIGEMSSDKLLDQLGISPKPTEEKSDFDYGKNVKLALTSFHSIYEIPEMKTRSKLEAVRPGNIIVSSPRYGAFILSSDLKKVLLRIEFPSSIGQQVHDVQVTDQGNIIYFNNDRIRDEKNPNPHSSVEIMDPFTKKELYVFTSNPSDFFFSFTFGSVQEIDSEQLLISRVTSSFMIINKNTKSAVMSATLMDKGILHTYPYTQRVRLSTLLPFITRKARSF